MKRLVIFTLLIFAHFRGEILHAQDSVGKRLEGLQKSFEAALEREVTAPFEAAVAELEKNYLAAVERAVAEETRAGRLESAVALRGEAKRVTEKAALPETDEGVTPALEKLRGTYRKALTSLEANRDRQAAPLRQKLDQALAGLQEEASKAGNLDGALAVKNARAALANETASPSGKAGTAPVPAAPSGPPVKPAMRHEEAARALALWVMEAGGGVTIESGDGPAKPSGADQLPRGDFKLLGANRKIGSNFAPKEPLPWKACAALPELTRLAVTKIGNIEGPQIAMLGGAKELQSLQIGASRFAPGAAESFPALGALSELDLRGTSGLSADSLARITASCPDLLILRAGALDTQWDTGAFSSLGGFKRLEIAEWLGKAHLDASLIEGLRACPSIRSIGFYGDFTIDPAIIPQLETNRQLNELFIGSPPMLSSLSALAGMKNLKVLRMSYSRLDDSGLQEIIRSAGPNLTELILNAAGKLTDSGFAGIGGLKLTKLDCARQDVTDAGLAHLAGMRDLRELILTGTKVTDAGVAELQKKLPKCVIKR